jgi:hypothetical protein
LDDIAVYNLNPDIDAELLAITDPPEVGINMTDAETVTVKVKNNGGAPISGFQLKLELDDELIATENYTGFINSLSTASYTFANKIDLSAAGTYSVRVTIDLEGDMEPSNDSKTKTVENKVNLGIDATGGAQPLVAWIDNDILYVKGLQAGDRCNVYSVMGQLIYSQPVHSETVSINLNARGFYIIQSGCRVVKIVY